MADLSASMDVEFSIAIPIEEPETTGQDKGYFHFAPTTALTITEVHLMVKTAPGADKDFTVDVHKGGTTIFSTQGNRPIIEDAATEDTSPAPDVTALAKDDILTVDVDVSTAGTAVANAVCIIRGTQAIRHPLS